MFLNVFSAQQFIHNWKFRCSFVNWKSTRESLMELLLAVIVKGVTLNEEERGRRIKKKDEEIVEK